MPMWSKRVTDTIAKGLGGRIRSKNEVEGAPKGFKLPANVKMFVPPSMPKPATVDPIEYKIGKTKKK